MPNRKLIEVALPLEAINRESARREVLARLLELNHQRYAEEVAAGLHEVKGSAKARSGAKARKAKATEDDGGTLRSSGNTTRQQPDKGMKQGARIKTSSRG